MNDLMLKMKTVANMENDMERWLQDRDRISRQLEGCQKKRDEAIRIKRVRIWYRLLQLQNLAGSIATLVIIALRELKDNNADWFRQQF